MRTLGVDLAAEPAGTATAAIDWSGSRAEVVAVRIGQTDGQVAELAATAERMGLDSPLGWPEAFVEFVVGHRDGRTPPATDLAGRRLLAYRETDRAITGLTGLRPLSVAADRIGHAAMRAAGLMARLGADGHDLRRDGRGFVVESYPSGALKQWGLPHRSYKGSGGAAARAALIDSVSAAFPALEWGSAEETCRESDHAFDAVICALIARAAALGAVNQPDEGQARLAATEGWIVVPTCPIRQLAQPARFRTENGQVLQVGEDSGASRSLLGSGGLA